MNRLSDLHLTAIVGGDTTGYLTIFAPILGGRDPVVLGPMFISSGLDNVLTERGVFNGGHIPILQSYEPLVF